jgi:hypothetical protein
MVSARPRSGGKVHQHHIPYFYCLGVMSSLLLRMPADPLHRAHDGRVVQVLGHSAGHCTAT